MPERLFARHPAQEQALESLFRSEKGLFGQKNSRLWHFFDTRILFYAFSAPKGDTCVLAYMLHQLPVAEGLEIIREAQRHFAGLILVDYRLPERNLDFPAVWLGRFRERLGSHFSFYTAYMRSGGIEGTIMRLGVVPQKRLGLLGGSVSCLYMDERAES